MKLLNLLILLSTTATLIGQEAAIIAEEATIQKVGTGYIFTEGPAVSPKGIVYFTDQPNDHIYTWEEGRGVALWSDNTGRSNGMYFDHQGRLLSCADLDNQIVVIKKNKKRKVLFEKYEGKHLNGPNDLWATPHGDIYFTDPYYHRDYWQQGQTEAQDVRGVYHLSRKGVITRVADDYKQPNGIVGTPDGKWLYVADINDKKIWKYRIAPDGTLSEKTYFAPHGSDGMTIDNRGNIYLTMDKVWVYSPEGTLIQQIEVPEKPSNVCFGGKNKDILFITARTSVYTLQMNVSGVQ